MTDRVSQSEASEPTIETDPVGRDIARIAEVIVEWRTPLRRRLTVDWSVAHALASAIYDAMTEADDD